MDLHTALVRSIFFWSTYFWRVEQSTDLKILLEYESKDQSNLTYQDDIDPKYELQIVPQFLYH